MPFSLTPQCIWGASKAVNHSEILQAHTCLVVRNPTSMKPKILAVTAVGVSALCIAGFFGTRSWAVRTGEVLASQGAPTFARAKSRLELAHKLGSSQAAYRLGMLFWDGKSVDTNYPEAINWLQRAADAGNGDALFQLFWAYVNGLGVKEDAEKAKQYLLQAVREHNPKAAGRLAEYRLEGSNGEAKDPQDAFRLAMESAKGGDPDGLYLLGRIKVSMAYPEGALVPGASGTPREGLELIEKAAERGHYLAAYVIGAAYLAMPARDAAEFTSVALDPVDPNRSYPTNFGSAAGMNAALNVDGKLVPRDTTKAEKYLLMAAKGFATGPGELLYRKLYQNKGINPNPDPAQAKRILERLTAAGDSWAPGRLGFAYMDGEPQLGISKDPEKARDFFKIGESRGDQDSARVLNFFRDAEARANEPVRVERLGVYNIMDYPRIQGLIRNVSDRPHNARVTIALLGPTGNLIDTYTKTVFGIMPNQAGEIDIAIAPYHRNARAELRNLEWQ